MSKRPHGACVFYGAPDVETMIEMDRAFACPACGALAGESCKDKETGALHTCPHGFPLSHFGRRIIRITAERRHASAHGPS